MSASVVVVVILVQFLTVFLLLFRLHAMLCFVKRPMTLIQKMTIATTIVTMNTW